MHLLPVLVAQVSRSTLVLLIRRLRRADILLIPVDGSIMIPLGMGGILSHFSLEVLLRFVVESNDCSIALVIDK